jgi:hypothetical protein
MKKLSRNPMRPEHEPGAFVEIWQPSWKCFCCHDSGIVVSHLARIAIEGFDSNRDKLPRCQNKGCEEGSHWDGDSVTHCVDYRLTPAICQELDSIERSNWRRTTELKQQQIREHVAQLSQKKSLRQRDRTPDEQISAIEKHTAVLAGWGLEAQNEEEKEWLASRNEMYD